ncbi:MAG: response regulator [Bdellovibrionales bacterium]
MKVTVVDDSIAEFVHFIATKKRFWNDWQFAHIDIDKDESRLNIDELEQFLGFHIKTQNAWLMRLPPNGLVLFTQSDSGLEFSKLERAINESFSGLGIRLLQREMNEASVEQLTKILDAYVSRDNDPAQIAFLRMKRMGNTILVVDDDPMVLKQMEKILSGFGNVVTIQDIKMLKESYVQYAPNMMFLDIHLGAIKGNQILRKLKKDIDPNAFVVMISSDTQKEVIVEIKQSGADGFVMKPFNRNQIFQYVMKAPTILTKA